MQVDDELRGVFWDLRQIGDHDDTKYTDRLLHRLAGRILDGQAHEQIAFRLCHLIHCAVFAGGHNRRTQSYLEFFCDPGAGRAGCARGYFHSRLPEEGDNVHLLAASDRILIRYPDREAPVYVSYASIPLLSAFMEFLLNTVHFDAVREIVAPLETPGASYRDVQDVANALSRTVYAYLREHSSPIQEIRDFDTIGKFMLKASRRNDRNDFDAGDIDDEAILEFWREHSVDEDSEFKTYRKSFRAFLRFGQMVRGDELRAGFDRPVNLGGDRTAGEWDPADPSSPELRMMSDGANVAGDWQAGIEEEDQSDSILERLASSEIKFLKGTELKLLEIIETHAHALIGIAQSLLRDRCFGHAQGRITAALKKPRSDISNLVFAAPETSYDDVVDAFENVQTSLNELIDAAAYVLLNKGGDDDDALSELDFAMLTRGRKALYGLKRKGFDLVRNGDPVAVEEFRNAVPDIIALREFIAPLRKDFNGGVPWSACQEEDQVVFGEQFAQIYGVVS
jgi:hypothetical protein